MKRTISSLLTILILLPALLTVSNAYDAVDTSFLVFASSLSSDVSEESYTVECTASDCSVTLSWKNIAADEYIVYFKRSNSDEWMLLKTTTKQVLIVTGLQNGLRYDFKMCFDGIESEIVTAVPHAADEIMLSVPEYCQYPEYPTGCECASLYMLLQYYGVDVTMEEIVEVLPKGSAPYEGEDGVLYGANPDKEFVGDPRDENSYGVYNEPIRNTAEKFRSGAISQSGATVGDILKILSSGNPVIVWFTSNLEMVIDYRNEWLDYNTDETIRWASYEHAVVVYGISEELVYYNDPQTGSGGSLELETFAAAFESFGGRIVYYLE